MKLRLIIVGILLLVATGFFYVESHGAKGVMGLRLELGLGFGTSPAGGDALLLEDPSFYLWLETGDYLLLE